LPTRQERIATLQDANQRRQESKRAAVDQALRSMLGRRERVSVAAVANRAGVSRNFVYSHEDLLRQVEEAAASHSPRMAQPRVKPSTEASLRNRLADALDALGAANEENKRLHTRIEHLTGELAREIANRPAQRQSR